MWLVYADESLNKRGRRGKAKERLAINKKTLKAALKIMLANQRKRGSSPESDASESSESSSEDAIEETEMPAKSADEEGMDQPASEKLSGETDGGSSQGANVSAAPAPTVEESATPAPAVSVTATHVPAGLITSAAAGFNVDANTCMTGNSGGSVPGSVEKTNLEDVRQTLHAAVQFAVAVQDAVERKDNERFRAIFQDMTRVLPSWRRCDNLCE
jgi:hypothetical protein